MKIKPKLFNPKNSKQVKRFATLAVCVLVAVVGVYMLFPGKAAVVYNVPASIPADCSRDVQDEITNFIKTVPDGSTILFPPNGCYKQSTRIFIPDRNNLIIDGNRSTFRNSSTSAEPGKGNFVVLRGTDITFQNVIARGTFDQVPEGGKYSLNYPVGIGWEPNHAFGFWGTNGGGVRDSEAHHVWGDGVATAFDGILDPSVYSKDWQVARNLVIERIFVDNVSRVCLGPTQGINNTFRDSYFKNCWMSGIDAEADGDWDGNVHNNLPIDGLKLINNTFEGYNLSGIAVPVGGDFYHADPADRTMVGNIEIRGNKLLTGPTLGPCAPSILIGVSGYSSSNRIKNVTIKDNEIVAMANAVFFNHADGGLIQDNKFFYTDYGLEGGAQVQCDPGYRDMVKIYDSTDITQSNNSTIQGGIPATSPADTMGPTVSIATPSSSATLSGTTTVSASANDNVGVVKVEFLIDGTVKGTDTSSPYGYSWDTASVTNGSHTLTAKAYDAARNQATSAAVVVTVSNGATKPPAGDTQAPSAPAGLQANAVSATQVNLTWTASTDNVGVVIYYIYRNGTLLGFAYPGQGTSFGDATVVPGSTYSYQVKADDAAGNISGPSNTVTVTTPSNSPSALVGDVNKDGKVNFDDALAAIRRWNTSDTDADITKDGKVNFDDALQVIRNWKN